MYNAHSVTVDSFLSLIHFHPKRVVTKTRLALLSDRVQEHIHRLQVMIFVEVLIFLQQLCFITHGMCQICDQTGGWMSHIKLQPTVHTFFLHSLKEAPTYCTFHSSIPQTAPQQEKYSVTSHLLCLDWALPCTIIPAV